jgi:4'-phosphopantetheinyl transferase
MAVSLPTEPAPVRTLARTGRSRARSGVVEIWRVDLADTALDGLVDLLVARERARARRLVRERDRVLWARSRGALRELLGRCAGRDPRELVFELGPHGKPFLASAGKGPDGLRFNLSHSGELLLIAVTAGAEVGVDVERARARYTAELLRAWTRHEALVKCLGTGLAHAPVGMEDPEALGSPAGALADDGTPWTTQLDVGPGAFAAVAVNARSAPTIVRSTFPAGDRHGDPAQASS